MKNNEDVDRISELPQGILHHILSFLDIKPAIQTCILSSKWRYVWKSLPFLTFNSAQFITSEFHRNEEEQQQFAVVVLHVTYHGFDSFVNFVNNVLYHRDSSSIIRKFHFYYYHGTKEEIDDHLYTWILVALQSHVEDLYLEILVNEDFVLPESLFTCKSLQKLDLKFCGHHGRMTKLTLPNSMFLPFLTTLVLQSARFEVGDDVCKKIFDTCPFLESLTLGDCVFDQPRVVKIYAMKLKHLAILNHDMYRFDDVVNHPINKYTYKICAPNLITFRCWDILSNDYSIENLSCLVEAKVNMEIEEFKRYQIQYEGYEAPPQLDDETRKFCAQRLMKILFGLHNVQTLNLSTWVIEIIAGAPALMECTHIKFPNLKHLKLHTCLSTYCINAIMYLLKIAPVESLCLKIEKKFSTANYPFLEEVNLVSAELQGDWEASVSLQFMLYHLKLVKIKGVLGRLNELMFLEVLLKNGIVLEKVLVDTSLKPSPESWRVNLKKLLLALPRASLRTEIVIRQNVLGQSRESYREWDGS